MDSCEVKGRDENELRRHVHANSVDRHVIRKLLKRFSFHALVKASALKHEVAFSIDDTIRSLDVPEEIISTLLCYLELHEKRYVECAKSFLMVVQCRLERQQKECPPLAMALALHKNKSGEDPNILEFPVIDVAAAMGWESGICKNKLKNLEWITVNNQSRRSSLSVQFSNLGFRLLAPGNLSDDELDAALDTLFNRVVDQEKKALLQLRAVHKSLMEITQPSFRSCISTDDSLIKNKVREYFNSSDPLVFVIEDQPKKFNEEQLISDIRALICMYRDNTFTGRSIARIFQGIQSPNYPATMWGRCKFWRSYLDIDFHTIVRIATLEIIKMR
ncbi:hypothetical protein NQ318_019399 [Aromia moschata]|uniref:Uncharacterized protein n=1 Tax=Aromia moschata TaxID=1265417 RepID=A0AAV8XEJ4_9CUCU|nr:hypothetical protein NQ318_019399 [Aromia moschata]